MAKAHRRARFTPIDKTRSEYTVAGYLDFDLERDHDQYERDRRQSNELASLINEKLEKETGRGYYIRVKQLESSAKFRIEMYQHLNLAHMAARVMREVGLVDVHFLENISATKRYLV